MDIGERSAVTWLGHGTCLIVSGGGTQILVDPWITGNPSAPAGLTVEGLRNVGLLAITHGHFDHIGSLAEVAKATGATVVCTTEMAAYCQSIGITNIWEMNKGGTFEYRDVAISMVHADHASGIVDTNTGPNSYGGEAVGYVFSFAEQDALPVYVAGDTNVFSDMTIIRDLYRPELGLVPIDGNYNMGPQEAAYASRLLDLTRVVPIHFGTFPKLQGTADQFREQLRQTDPAIACQVIEPGQSVPLAHQQNEADE